MTGREQDVAERMQCACPEVRAMPPCRKSVSLPMTGSTRLKQQYYPDMFIHALPVLEHTENGRINETMPELSHESISMIFECRIGV